MIAKLTQSLTGDIWRIRSEELPWRKAIWIRPLRVILLSLRRFDEDKCLFRASALTFYSALSIVPVLGMAFGLAKGFGFEKVLEKQLLARFQGQEEIIMRLMGYARSFIETTKGGVIAGVGILVLFWTIIRVLGNIEDSFNHIWEVKKGRSFSRKTSDYLSAMLVCPFLLIISSAVTVVIKSEVKLIVDRIALLGPISPAIFVGLSLLPYCAIWILFTFVYMFMPNTRINFKSGALAGIVAGVMYQLFQYLYLSFQIGVARYNAVYGSFAAFPLFLIWLQISWVIVLFGAELSFAYQNEKSYEFEPDSTNVSYAFKKLLTLRVAHLFVKDFARGGKGLSVTGIVNGLKIPVRLAQRILEELTKSGVISRTYNNENKEPVYQPALDTDLFTIKFVIDRIEQYGSDALPVARSQELEKLSECLTSFGQLIEKSPANMRLKDI
ncbi:MAG: YihY/virulence factor BrkB family protein [Deltaproteobacteria bacterium]|nr:MAG: YihY/virulence factor BrkB family protein [Deltaproteobacteria bacterium]